jgi:transposase
MDDNAMPHRSRAVTAYPQSEVVTSVLWPAMSPDLNPIDHIWDMLGRRIQARGTSCAKHSSVGSSIASGMAATITTRTSDV